MEMVPVKNRTKDVWFMDKKDAKNVLKDTKLIKVEFANMLMIIAGTSHNKDIAPTVTECIS